jgi:hypothetical protein
MEIENGFHVDFNSTHNYLDFGGHSLAIFYVLDHFGSQAVV